MGWDGRRRASAACLRRPTTHFYIDISIIDIILILLIIIRAYALQCNPPPHNAIPTLKGCNIMILTHSTIPEID
jgi:hypothetical protein